ncbi:hypothetical protein EHS25_008380 [Saitozyma podzolica]|uniref:Zn(2)-C6 fungal-type domain-containing protein n=1 Tax=Saitozyma podzolica TaxID=1890683 RepID=A0A427YP99_9TREE|nr:hypothetical protein EHS25_008380 [Saitozyma podzolica]
MEPGDIPRALYSTASHSGQLVGTPSRAEPFVSTNDNDGSRSLAPASGPSRSTRSTSRPVHGSAGKQPPSCDACRTRKLKCSGRPEVIELDQGIAKIPCEHCREWSLECSYLYQRKRRGRKNRIVQRLVEEQKARRRSTADDIRESEDESEDEDEGLGLPQSAFYLTPPGGVVDPAALHAPVGSASSTHSFRHPSTAHPPHPHQTHPPHPPQPLPMVHGISSTSPNDDVSPSIALSEASVPPSTSIESILDREMAMYVIKLYFDHVHCIIPCIHRPSFSANLAAREEEKRPIFFALVMAMIACTLIHVPKSFFVNCDVRRLSDHCLKACYAVTRREMDNPTVDLICIKYFVFIVHNKHGNVGLEASAFGEAQYLAISLGLHREDTYAGLNPIEIERRRRIWFLIYNADKFEAVARNKPVLLPSDEFRGPESTELCAELDDKSITAHGFMPGSTAVPLICGFNIMTRIVTIIGDVLIHQRDIRRRPPKDPEGVLAALKDVRGFQQRIRDIVDRLPRPFQLDPSGIDELPAPGWEEIMRDELHLFFQDPMSSESAKDGYLVLKANIHVTLAMTRLRLILHREDLLNRCGPLGTPSRNAAELVAADLGENVDWRHGVYQDLFQAVHGIPIQALAANGPSLVVKIRVVAVTLLDALPAGDYGDSNYSGITAYLLDFLNIMTSIENQFAD